MSRHRWVPSVHPRDRRGRFTSSGTSEMTSAERDRMAEVIGDFHPHHFASAEHADSYALDQSSHLTRPQAAAVRAYSTGDTAAAVNQSMRSPRGDDTYDDMVQDMIDGLRPADHDLVLSRTVSERQLGDALPDLEGMKVRDAAFSSTSLGVHFEGDDQVHMSIAAPAGTPMLFTGRHSGEPDTREVLLAPSQELGVASVRANEHGGHNMTLVALGSDSQFGDPITYKKGDEERFLDRFSEADRPQHAGQSAETLIRTDPATGEKMVHKRTDPAETDQAEAEVLGHLVGEAVGAPTPKVWRLSETSVAMEYVDGKTIGRWLTEHGFEEPEDAPWFRGPDADRLAVMDYVTGNRDRNMGNVMVTADGRPYGIDHGYTLMNPVFARHGLPLDGDENMTWGVFGSRPWERPGVDLGMVDEIEPRLAALKGDFDRIGGDGPARHTELMRRTALLRGWLEPEDNTHDRHSPVTPAGDLGYRAAARSQVQDWAGDRDLLQQLHANTEQISGGDQRLATLWAAQGFDGRPQVLDPGEFANLPDDHIRIYRGVRADNKTTAQAYVDQWQTGDTPFPGRGVAGNGTYVSDSKGVAAKYAGRGQASAVMSMALRPDARIVDHLALYDEAKAAHRRLERVDPDLAKAVGTDLGRWGTMLGYDAIRSVSPKKTNYVILNRTAVIMNSDADVRG